MKHRREELRAFLLGHVPEDRADNLAVELLLDDELFEAAEAEEEALFRSLALDEGSNQDQDED